MNWQPLHFLSAGFVYTKTEHSKYRIDPDTGYHRSGSAVDWPAEARPLDIGTLKRPQYHNVCRVLEALYHIERDAYRRRLVEKALEAETP